MLILLPRASLLKVLSSLPCSKETYKYDIIFRKQTVGRRILNREFYLHRILEQIKNSVKPEKTAFLCKCLFSSFLMACDLCIPDRNYNSYHGKHGSHTLRHSPPSETFRGGTGRLTPQAHSTDPGLSRQIRNSRS